MGLNKTTSKILVAEAGWENPGFLGVKEYPLSDFIGSDSFYYINLNKYLKSGIGLK